MSQCKNYYRDNNCTEPIDNCTKFKENLNEGTNYMFN